MTPETSRLVVTVLDTPERAARAAAALAADGFRPDQVRLIAEPDVPPDFPADLVAAGVAAEAGTYYAGEVRDGRWLLVVSCHPANAGSVMASVGPHGGSLRVPDKSATALPDHDCSADMSPQRPAPNGRTSEWDASSTPPIMREA